MLHQRGFCGIPMEEKGHARSCRLPHFYAMGIRGLMRGARLRQKCIACVCTHIICGWTACLPHTQLTCFHGAPLKSTHTHTHTHTLTHTPPHMAHAGTLHPAFLHHHFLRTEVHVGWGMGCAPFESFETLL
jgi:hypothetical protein